MADLASAIEKAEGAARSYEDNGGYGVDPESVAILIAAAREAESALAEERRRREEAEAIIRRILDAHDARLSERGHLVYGHPSMGTGFPEAIRFLAGAPAPQPAPMHETDRCPCHPVEHTFADHFAKEQPAPLTSSSTVSTTDPPAAPLPTCGNCGSNFITPAPAPDAVAEAAERCANDGCGCVRSEPDPDGIGVRILWCPDRWPGDTEQWCWSCQMRAALDARKPDETAEACRLHWGTGAGLAVRMAMPGGEK